MHEYIIIVIVVITDKEERIRFYKYIVVDNHLVFLLWFYVFHDYLLLLLSFL